MADFDNKTPTHLAATHAISKSKRNFQNRIPRELDKKFYIPRISMIYWSSSNFLKLKNRPQKKVSSIPNPGVQPILYRLYMILINYTILTESIRSMVESIRLYTFNRRSCSFLPILQWPIDNGYLGSYTLSLKIVCLQRNDRLDSKSEDRIPSVKILFIYTKNLIRSL